MRKNIILCLLLCPAAAAASGPGTTAAPFLKAAMSPRAMAMGGAFGALADDSGAVFVNPAGLARQSGSEVSLDFSSWLQGARMGDLAYSGSAGGERVGLGLTVMTVDGIERRGDDAAGIVPANGTFGADDAAVSLAWAKEDIAPDSLPRLDGGLAAKFVRSKIDDKSAVAAAVDAGAIYRATDRLSLSLALQNLGTKMKFDSEADPLPLDLRAGMLYRVSGNFSAAAEVSEYLNDEKFYPSVGCEYWVRGALALRAGYRFGYDTATLGSEAGLSLGLGVKSSGVGLDYAYLPFGDLGDVHRFGFWMQF